jgi:hypothetical protein
MLEGENELEMEVRIVEVSLLYPAKLKETVLVRVEVDPAFGFVE